MARAIIDRDFSCSKRFNLEVVLALEGLLGEARAIVAVDLHLVAAHLDLAILLLRESALAGD